ncbi:hypothetical protein BGZ95_002971 [Linnemannia exigua]|uniref:Uncharacterized protein n=1 Tax=Linnemannia exigua TaxID=604196 RepID=A0AAD4D4V8_9FUNG|nr:hypothetical protein BGZ95_002971 [Linnemannia exigua]
MLLSDKDIRPLDLSGCFCERIGLRHLGASVHVRGLVVCLQGDKTRSDMKPQYSVALRHNNNFARCPVRAFAFHMFERYKGQDEPIPQFGALHIWPNIKVICTGTNPLPEIDYNVQHKRTAHKDLHGYYFSKRGVTEQCDKSDQAAWAKECKETMLGIAEVPSDINRTVLGEWDALSQALVSKNMTTTPKSSKQSSCDGSDLRNNINIAKR